MKRVPILIVEDDPALLESICDILKEKGFEVGCARTAEQALKLADEREFKIALLDIHLPDMEGTKLFRLLKEKNPKLEGIIFTGYASLESAVEALKEGILDYLQKPIEWDKLFESIEKAIKKREMEEKREEEIKYYKNLSVIDSLTGLYNNAYFKELLAQEIKRAERYRHPISLLMIDIDDFKKWQDKRGHLAGDRALKEIGSLLKSLVRGVDIVSRYGGEEFAILMTETPKEGAFIASERRRKAREGLRCQNGKDPLTVSIGVAEFPKDATKPEELIEKADMALYRAKREGKNRTYVWEK